MTTHKTLEQLEKDIWPDPDYGSHVVMTCHALRKKPVRDFTTEELRIMIGQDIGTKYLLPRALDILKNDPLAEGDFHPGDLLYAVLMRPTNLTKSDRERLKAFCEIALGNDTQLPKDVRTIITTFLDEDRR